MLVPAMQSTGTRSSSSTSSTPRCAPPRAPPPPRTSPMRGLAGDGASAAAAMSDAAARSAASALDLEREGREARAAVIVVLVLGALEPADDSVRHRREHDFDQHLADELREHRDRDLVVRQDRGAVEGERIEDERVDAFAEEGRADGARPEPPPGGHDLHLREHVGIHELAAEVRDHGGARDAPRVAERDLVDRLVGPEGRGRKRHDDERHEGGERERGESRPDDAAAVRITVHLGEEIAERARRSISHNGFPPRDTSATDSPAYDRTNASTSAPSTMLSAKCAPIAARSTLGDQAKAHRGESNAWRAPAAAALRSSVPTLPGSWMSSSTSARSASRGTGFDAGVRTVAITLGAVSRLERESKSVAPKTVMTAGEARSRSATISVFASAVTLTATASGFTPASRYAARRCAPSRTDSPLALRSFELETSFASAL